MKRLPLLGFAIFLLAAAPTGGSLRVRMEDRLNPAFTRVSYQLFHARPASEDELLTAAAQLELNARELARKPTSASSVHEADPQFRIYATQLHTYSRALLTAITEGAERPDLEHWFNHVRASCEACHSQFKENNR
jgi:cytochrome c556